MAKNSTTPEEINEQVAELDQNQAAQIEADLAKLIDEEAQTATDADETVSEATTPEEINTTIYMSKEDKFVLDVKGNICLESEVETINAKYQAEKEAAEKLLAEIKKAKKNN